MVTGMMANIWRFLLFPPKTHSRLGQFLAKAGIAENAKALEGRGVAAPRCVNPKVWLLYISTQHGHHCRTELLKIIIGHIYADFAKLKLPATSQPAGECRPLCFSITAVSDRLR